jgi:hypothetical protein
MRSADMRRSFSNAAHCGGDTTSQLLHFQPFAKYRGLDPTIGHVPCTFLLEMCV